MVRLAVWAVAGLATLFASTADAAAVTPATCRAGSTACDVPRYKPFMLLKNYAPAKTWCASKYPVRPETTTVTRTKTITRREDEPIEERASTACRSTDFLCQILEALRQSAPDVQLALCTCLQNKPPPTTKTKVVTITKRAPAPASPAVITDTCPVDSNSCNLARYKPFALLRSYAPAKQWCASNYPVTATTQTVTVPAAPAAKKAQVTERAELDERAGSTACRSKDYQCSILQYLQSGPATFAAAMCSCLQGKPTTNLVTVTASPVTTPTTPTAPTDTTTPTDATTPTENTTPEAVTPTPTPAPTTCAPLSPTPTQLMCGKNYVYSSASNYKLIKLGEANSAADCAKDCESTSDCLSFSFSAPGAANELAICDLYSVSVSDLDTDGAVVPGPAPAGQKLQDFYDIGCFSCPAPASVTNPTPIPTPTTTTETTPTPDITTPTPTPPTECELRSSRPGASCGNSYVYSSSSYTNALLLGHASTTVDCATACKSTKNCVSFSFLHAVDPSTEGTCILYSVSVGNLETGNLITTTEAADAQKFYDLECYNCPDVAVTTEAPPITTPTPTPPAPDCAKPTQVSELDAVTCNRLVYSVSEAAKLDQDDNSAEDIAGCSYSCFQNSNCKSFVFSSDTNSKACTLYGKTYSDLAGSIPATGDAYQGALYDLDCFALPSECPAPPTRTEFCIPVDHVGAAAEGYQCGSAAMLKNEDFLITTSSVSSADSCKQKCKNNPSCKSFGVGGVSPSFQCKLFTKSYSELLDGNAIGSGSDLNIFDAGCYGCEGHEPTPTPTPTPTSGAIPSCQPAAADETSGLFCNANKFGYPGYQLGERREVQTDLECYSLCHANPDCQSAAVMVIESKKMCILTGLRTDVQMSQYAVYDYSFGYYPAIKISDRGCHTCEGETRDTPPAGACELAANRTPWQCPFAARLLSTAHTVPGGANNVATRKECAAWCHSYSGCAAFSILEVSGQRQCLRYTKSISELEYTFGDIVQNPVTAPQNAPAVLMFDAACYSCEGGDAPTCDGDVREVSTPPNAVCGTGADITSQDAYLVGAPTTATSLEDCAHKCLTMSGCSAIGFDDVGEADKTCRLLTGTYNSLLGTSLEQDTTSPELAIYDANCFACGSAGDAYTPICNYPGQQVYGINELSSPLVQDERSCAEQCAQMSRCRAYAYSNRDGTSGFQCHMFIASVGSLQNAALLRSFNGDENFYTYIYNDMACPAPPADDGSPVCGRTAHFLIPSRGRGLEPRRVPNGATCIELCRTSYNCGSYSYDVEPGSDGLIECSFYTLPVHSLLVRQALTLPDEPSEGDRPIWDLQCPNDVTHDTAQKCGIVAYLNNGLLQVGSTSTQIGRHACRENCRITERCLSYGYGQEWSGQGVCYIFAATTSELLASSQLTVTDPPRNYHLTFDDLSCEAPTCGVGTEILGVYAAASGLDASSAAVLRFDEAVGSAQICTNKCNEQSSCKAWSVWWSAGGSNMKCSLYSNSVGELVAAGSIAPETQPQGATPSQDHSLYFDRGCSVVDLPVCGELTQSAGTYAWTYLYYSLDAILVDQNTVETLVASIDDCHQACIDASTCRSWAYYRDEGGRLFCSLFRQSFSRLTVGYYGIYPSGNDGSRQTSQSERLFFDRICAVPAGTATAQTAKRGLHARRTIGM